MSRRHFNAKDVVPMLNMLKNTLVSENKPFTKDQFLQGLKSCGIPSAPEFWSAVRNCECTEYKGKLLTEIRKGLFVFTNEKKPICFSDLRQIYNMYRSKVNAYQKAWEENKKLKAAAQEKEQEKNAPSDEIQAAIDLLKSHGFEVLAPVAMLYAKM